MLQTQAHLPHSPATRTAEQAACRTGCCAAASGAEMQTRLWSTQQRFHRAQQGWNQFLTSVNLQWALGEKQKRCEMIFEKMQL